MPQPRITVANLAWAAGFLDGEGHFYTTKNQFSKRKNGKLGIKSYSYFKIEACQVDKTILIKLQQILGGTVSGPYSYPPSKPYYAFTVCTAAESVFKRLFPYLSKIKRKQGVEALKLLRKQNALNRRKYAHQF